MIHSVMLGAIALCATIGLYLMSMHGPMMGASAFFFMLAGHLAARVIPEVDDV